MTTTDERPLEERCINVIRGIAMDAPRAANSGHSGTAMALAPAAYALWSRVLRFDPERPDWPDRDRFVLSCGHASILLYSLLHLTGYDLTLDDLRSFRQWGSATPGHPEVHHTPGVEVTTGPLGQGLGNSVGLAIAEEHLRARLGADVADHHTFVFAGDGDLMEGISHEAASFAGHLGLGRLVVLYDDNHITIDGPTELTLDDDPVGRFEAYGWHVEDLGEIADDVDALEAAFRRAMAVEDKPSLLVLRSHIGYPSPELTDTSDAHGSPFSPDEIARTKELMGLPADEAYWIPDDVLDAWRSIGARGRQERLDWEQRTAGRPVELSRADDWADHLPTWEVGDSVATRVSSKDCLDALLGPVPALMGGGADLTGNTGVAMADTAVFDRADRSGRLVHFGVREHAMGAVMNGMALHGGILPIGGTFFVFSDYMRPAVRLAALSEAHVIYSWSHDSVGLGEDGPTHQPVEHLASLRAIPGICLIRPADANECATAWRVAVTHRGPIGLILSRQKLPVLEGTAGNEGVLRGGYVLHEVDAASITLVATGSEVSLAIEAAERLSEAGSPARVVSLPSWELFAAQDDEYRAAVIPDSVPSLSVEAGVTFGWDRWVDDAVGIDRFGASAPGHTVMRELGISVDHVVEQAQALLRR